MGFRYGNFILKSARGKKSLASREPTALERQAFLTFGGEEISKPQTRPIRKSYIPETKFESNVCLKKPKGKIISIFPFFLDYQKL